MKTTKANPAPACTPRQQATAALEVAKKHPVAIAATAATVTAAWIPVGAATGEMLTAALIGVGVPYAPLLIEPVSRAVDQKIKEVAGEYADAKKAQGCE